MHAPPDDLRAVYVRIPWTAAARESEDNWRGAYLNATERATGCSAGAPAGSCGATGTTPPSGTIANSPSSEAGFAFMWHSHNEREITTNNIFPGGMMMMMLVDSREFVIDESN